MTSPDTEKTVSNDDNSPVRDGENYRVSGLYTDPRAPLRFVGLLLMLLAVVAVLLTTLSMLGDSTPRAPAPAPSRVDPAVRGTLLGFEKGGAF